MRGSTRHWGSSGQGGRGLAGGGSTTGFKWREKGSPLLHGEESGWAEAGAGQVQAGSASGLAREEMVLGQGVGGRLGGRWIC